MSSLSHHMINHSGSSSLDYTCSDRAVKIWPNKLSLKIHFLHNKFY